VRGSYDFPVAAALRNRPLTYGQPAAALSTVALSNSITRSETLEDVRNIMSQSGSGAAVGVPLLEGATGSGSSAAAPAKPTCSAALLLGFPSAADVTAP
jgi:hypothetical protein